MIGYIIAVIILILWRSDVAHAARERKELYDRIAANSLPAYDAHLERIAERGAREENEFREMPLFEEDDPEPLYTQDELEQLQVDIEAVRINTARDLHG